MIRTLLLALCLTAPARALDDVYLQYDGVTPPPADGDEIGLVDHWGVVIARPRPEVFTNGLDHDTLNTIVAEALAHRDEPYDFAVVVHTPRLPTTFTAAAFHLAYNNSELEGIGTTPVSTPTIRARSVLWMNHLQYWRFHDARYVDWVFAHELSHYWLARPRLPEGPPTALLGRQTAHWSYFVHTPNSPIEGNAWIDNGDGTFTTDVKAESTFSELDLYLMGFGEAEDVPDFFYIADVEGTEKNKASQPQHITSLYAPEPPETVRGTRVDVTIDDIIEANGVRSPSVAESPTHFRMLPIFIVGPTEMVSSQDITRINELTSTWSKAWSHFTRDRSTCSFTIDESWDIPPRAPPTVVPKAAW